MKTITDVSIDELVIKLIQKNNELVDAINELMDKIQELEMRIIDLEDMEEEMLVDEEHAEYIEKTDAIDAVSALLG